MRLADLSRARAAVVVAVAVGLVLVAILPVLLKPYALFLATTCAITAIVAMSLGVVTGRAGMMSLCQLSFGAVGAWAVAYLNLHGWQLPTPIMVRSASQTKVPSRIMRPPSRRRAAGPNATADSRRARHPKR